MTRDEVMNLITQAANADTAPAALQQLQGAVSDLFTTNETLTQTVNDQNATIATLRDTNMRLFLSQTQKIEEKEQEEEKTPDQIFEELFVNPVLGRNKEE